MVWALAITETIFYGVPYYSFDPTLMVPSESGN